MIRLHRHEPDKNMQRFYALHVAPTLFGDFVLVTEWGRIGSPGTVRAQPYPTQAEAEAALAKRLRSKTAHGYRLAS